MVEVNTENSLIHLVSTWEFHCFWASVKAAFKMWGVEGLHLKRRIKNKCKCVNSGNRGSVKLTKYKQRNNEEDIIQIEKKMNGLRNQKLVHCKDQ